MMYRFSLVVLAALLAGSGIASAADKKVDAEARRYYEEGTKYYSLGDFPRAIENYKKAFEVKPDAVFLYNIAQAYRLAGDLPQAVFFYKSFLRSMPNAPNRGEVDGRIKEMEVTIAKQKETVGQPPNDPVEPGSKPAGSTGRGAGIAAGGGATEPPPAGGAGTGSGSAGGSGTAGTVGGGDSEGAGPKVPTAEEAARAQGQGGTTAQLGTSVSSGEQPRSRPFYTKWWFWTVVGVVAVGATVGVIAASGGKEAAPTGDFPSIAVF